MKSNSTHATRRSVRSAIFAVIILQAAATLFAHSADEPQAKKSEAWMKRHAELNQRAAVAGPAAQVVFVGDSITQGWEAEGREAWEHYYAGRHAVSLGIGGDRTQHVLWRLTHGNLEGLNPKVVVLLIGTNNSEGEDNTVGQIADGVTAIVQVLKARFPDTRLLLMAIFPRGENPNAQRGKVLQVNQVIQRLADGKQVRWLDLGSRLVRPDGMIPRELMPDFLHLSSLGYAIWAEAAEAEIAAALGEPPITSRPAGHPGT